MQNVKKCDTKFGNDKDYKAIKNVREEREVDYSREEVVSQQSYKCHRARDGCHTNKHVLKDVWQAY